MKKQTPFVRPSQDTAPTSPSPSGSVEAFVAALERAPRAGASGRLMFALDATLSRQRTWDRAMHIQSAMFEEASRINGLAIKLIYFRGFRECRASAWQSEGHALARLMQSIGCLGGQTQIARVLSFARREVAKAPVPALVYIGDCVEEDGDALAAMAGELGLMGCRLFLFHEGRDAYAAKVFRALASHSGGGYFQFDDTSAATLAQLLRAVARYASGGRPALERSGGSEDRLLLEQMR